MTIVTTTVTTTVTTSITNTVTSDTILNLQAQMEAEWQAAATAPDFLTAHKHLMQAQAALEQYKKALFDKDYEEGDRQAEAVQKLLQPKRINL